MAEVGADPVLDEGPARGLFRRVLVVAGSMVTLFGLCLMTTHIAAANSVSALPTTPASAAMSQHNLPAGRPGAISGTAAASPRRAASVRPSAPPTAVDLTTNLTYPAASDHAHPAGVSTESRPSGDSRSLPVGSSASPGLSGNPTTATGSSCDPVAVLRFAGDRFGRATAHSSGVVPSVDGRPGALLFDSRGPRLPG